MAHLMADPSNRILFAGNPGVGKSTLLNTIIGGVAFKAGVSLGTGMTTALDNYEKGDMIYTDTPGLDDVKTREKAAGEISSALAIGGNIKLIFVMTLEAGRMRGADMATMIQILDAIQEVGIEVNDKFSILINKMSNRVLRQLESSDRIETLLSQINFKYRVGHVGYMKFHTDANDADNVVLNDKHRLLGFLESASYITIQEGSDIHIRADLYEKTLEGLTARMRKLEQEKEERDQIISKLKNDMRRFGRHKYLKRLGIAAAGVRAGLACSIQ